LPEGIGRLQAESKELQRTIKALQEKLAVFEAQALVSRAVLSRDWRAAIEVAQWDAPGLKALATAATAQPRVIAILFNPSGGLIVVARSADVTFDSAVALKSLIARFGGRGGGRPELAQAGGLTGGADEVLEAARALAIAGGDTR
jgi:alanyl-tRNA synthetase